MGDSLSSLFVNTLTRHKPLAETMPDTQYEQVVTESYNLIDRRFHSLRDLVRVDQTNVNPFLMVAMAPAYNIFSPLEAAEYLQNAKMPHGDATAFGKFVEDRIFPIFGVQTVPEKQDPVSKTLFSPIDARLVIEDRTYLATWKAGPWTMNQAHANEMVSAFPQIHSRTDEDIVLGVFYGTPQQLNNKPALVRQSTGDYFHTLIGAPLWEFITGVRHAHMEILRAIREAQSRFALEHGGKTFSEHLVEARLELSESFRNSYGLNGGDEDMWEMLFENAF